MRKSKKTRLAAILCAGLLMATGTLSAGAAPANSLEQDQLVGEHLGQSGTSVKMSHSDAQIDYVTGNVFLKIGTSLTFMNYNSNYNMLYYNSQNAEESLFGQGFSSVFQQTIKPCHESVDPVSTEEQALYYTREDGKMVPLFPHRIGQGELIWEDQNQYGYRLQLEDDGYSLCENYYDLYHLFGADGQLTHYSLEHRLSYILGFDVAYKADKVSQIGLCAILGRDHGIMENCPYIFANHQMTRLSCIEIPGDNSTFSVRFDYDETGRLIHYRDFTKDYTFCYEGNSSRILKMNDWMGNEVEFKYALIDGLDKVDYITVKDAQGVLIEEKQFWYGDGITTITDMDGTVTTKTY